MFNYFKKSKESRIFSPVDGECIELIKVPDKMFSEKMLGDGVAFIFDDDFVCAPCDGKITMIAETKHAFGITDSNGMEVLVHVGLDTVNLNGEGFDVLVDKNQHVKAGAKILKIDRQIMDKNNIDLVTPVVITNSSTFTIKKNSTKLVKTGDLVISAVRN